MDDEFDKSTSIMAEIRIKKKSVAVWPWILTLLMLSFIAWFIIEFVWKSNSLFSDINNNDVYEYSMGESDITHTNSIDEYIALINDEVFISEKLDDGKALVGMDKLSDAIDELVKEQDIEDEKISSHQQKLSKQLDLDDKTVGFANSDKELNTHSLYTAADLLEEIQLREFPELTQEVSLIRQNLSGINLSEPFNHEEKVKEFLIHSGQLLQLMRDEIYEEASLTK